MVGVTELLTEIPDVDLDVVLVAEEVVSPHLVEDALPRQHLIGVGGEEPQQVELAHREIERGSSDLDLARGGVDAQIADSDDAVEIGLAPAKNRTDAGEKFRKLEGLDEVIVSTEFEALDPVGRLVPRREDDDSPALVPGNGAAQLPAIHPRHHEIEDDEIRFELVDRLEAGASVRRGPDVEALVGEAQRYEVGDARLIVDDEDPGRLPCHAGSIGWAGCRDLRRGDFSASSQPGADTEEIGPLDWLDVLPKLRRVRRPGPLVALSLIYFLGASAIMIRAGISVSPDYIYLLLVPVALVSGRFLRYLRDWTPFIAIFLGWEALRGIAPKLGISPHVADLAGLERFVFLGHLPGQVLQSAVTGTWQSVLAVGCTVIYFSHFIFPLAIGMVLWLLDRTQFLRFTTALMGMAFACFFIFLLAPTAPPWYATQHGAITGVTSLISQSLPSYVSPYYESLNPDPVAAFPSMHAAFPLMAYLALRPVSKLGSRIALVWVGLVAFAVVFLGQHYLVDVFAGWFIAGAAWVVLMHIVVPRVTALQWHPSVITTEPAEQRRAVA